MRIGLDFDNTIAGYDVLFARLAVEAGWLDPGATGSKKEIRDRVRALPDGEVRWMEMQARAYGPRMGEASLIDGVAPFLRACRRHGHEVVIVSHKTRFAAAAPQGANLRQAALAWMQRQGFFAAEDFGLARADVHFTDTRTEKCARIAALDCTLFVDDLEEVFRDPAFPPAVGRFLFHPGGPALPAGPFRAFADWTTLAEAVLAHG